jgi:hypothetical protein
MRRTGRRDDAIDDAGQQRRAIQAAFLWARWRHVVEQ